jgi:hypothetical protein
MLNALRGRIPLLIVALSLVSGIGEAQVVNRDTRIRATLRDKSVQEGKLTWSDPSAIRLRTSASGLESTIQRAEMSSVMKRIGHAESGAKNGAMIGAAICVIAGLADSGEYGGAGLAIAGGVLGGIGGGVIGGFVGSFKHSWVPITTNVSVRVRRN